jgi:hypothetical protein
MIVLLCVDCCGGHEERLKSGHHKSRLRLQKKSLAPGASKWLCFLLILFSAL